MAKDAKYIQFTRTKGTICHHLHLQNRHKVCTSSGTSNALQSQNKSKSNIKAKHQQHLTSISLAWVRCLRNESFFIIGRQSYNSIPTTLRDRKWQWRRKTERKFQKESLDILKNYQMLQEHFKTHFCKKSKSKVFCCIYS